MVTDLMGPLTQFIATYGVPAIFVLLVLDAAMLLPGIPGEILMIVLATKYADNYYVLGFLVLVATIAATLGSIFLYGIARGAGESFVKKHPRLFFMSPKTRDKLEHTFQRPMGQSLVFFARLFPLTRLLVNLPAGLARMPFMRFLILTFLGNLVFHAGLMYIAYETQRPDSAVATTSAQIQGAYLNPAWDYVQANWVFTIAGLVALGLLLSIRASIKTARHPGEGMTGSLIGTLATAALFWGGLALLVGLYVDPVQVYDTLAVTGYDPRQVAADLPYDVPFAPLSLVAALGGAAIFLAFLVHSIRRAARRRVKRHEKGTSSAGVPTVVGRQALSRSPSTPSGASPPRVAPLMARKK